MLKLGKIKIRAFASGSARERALTSSPVFVAAAVFLGLPLVIFSLLAIINPNVFIEPPEGAASQAAAQASTTQQQPTDPAPTEPTQEPSPTDPTTECGPYQHLQPEGCVCLPGHGGAHCSFSHASIFGGFPTYESLKGSPQFMPEDLQGWSPPAEVYLKFLEKVNASTVIEVGVWKGLSAIHMAKWLKSKNRGVLVAVDTWLGAPEFWSPKSMNSSERSLKLLHGWPTVYFQFLSNVVHQGLEDFIVPLPQTSKLATVLLMFKSLVADLVHIDAAHEYGSVREDIHLWWPFVRHGGYLIGDDISWPGVVKAAQEFSIVCELELELEGVKWAFRKPPIEWFYGRPNLPDFCSRGAYSHYDGMAIGLF